ncbi:MAG: hypothetical protein ABH864_00095 [archaeon]
MKIGIDLDGVVVDLVTPLLNYYNKKNGTSFVYRQINHHDFWVLLGLSRQDGVQSVDEFMEDTSFDVVKPQEGAIEAIKELGEEHELVVVTSRPELYVEKTLEWIDHYLSGVFDRAVFTHEYPAVAGVVRKGEICKAEKVDVMVEDFDRNLLGCAKFCKKVLLFDQPWNQKSQLPENGIRIKSWDDVLKQVNEIQSEVKE